MAHVDGDLTHRGYVFRSDGTVLEHCWNCVRTVLVYCVETCLSLQDFEVHMNEEEHNYIITKRIQSIVPGLGFCAVS